MSNKFANFCPSVSHRGNPGTLFDESARARARGRTAGLAAQIKVRLAQGTPHFDIFSTCGYIEHIWGPIGVPVHTQATRQPRRTWSATRSVVASSQEPVLLLGSIVEQRGPMVPGCSAPTHKILPVNNGIGLDQQRHRRSCSLWYPVRQPFARRSPAVRPPFARRSPAVRPPIARRSPGDGF
jgi:hypothetical protein